MFILCSGNMQEKVVHDERWLLEIHVKIRWPRSQRNTIQSEIVNVSVGQPDGLGTRVRDVPDDEVDSD